ncbi:YgfZ/GcvT domain-containing protein [Tianweitania sediminis]|uniref:Folate-binding protein YgfZ n=1 Tax=Tianweitania sediminis TaxID=1502156 RepID=A0A8J7UJM1_9HYPH|nr:folate-binding protein YgfZ [Tianweitania sediminis]MBP0438960.1 folate-binding protein YgfZ [Tianweitania sediminis]
MPTVRLAHRALILVTGPDAESFLQNILTVDLTPVQAGEVVPGALLSPQGKILFDFLVSRVEGGFRLDCRAAVATDFVRRLTMYRLRAKAEITVEDESLVTVSLRGEAEAENPGFGLVDRRFADGSVVRHYGTEPAETSDLMAWTAYRVKHGIAESGSDYELGDAFPHDVLLDQIGAVGFKKGCYVGQEVVSRMQHRGTARRRILLAEGEADLPPTGTDITVAGRLVGSMGSGLGRHGLALVRIDKVKAAMDNGLAVTAGDVPVTLSIPGWAKFGFPEAAADAGD